MQSHVEVRLLDVEGVLLAGTLVPVEAGNRQLVPLGGFEAVGEADGTIFEFVVFWPVLHVQKRTSMTGRVNKGQIVRLALGSSPLLTVGSDDGPLPALTFRRPVAIGVPAGNLGVVGS